MNRPCDWRAIWRLGAAGPRNVAKVKSPSDPASSRFGEGFRGAALQNRVVHRGSLYAGPVVITPAVLAELCTAGAVASTAQSRGVRGRPGRDTGCAAASVLRHQFSPNTMRSRGADLRFPASWVALACSAMAFTVYRTNTSRPFSRESHPRFREAGSLSPSGEWSQSVRIVERNERRYQPGLHCAGRALHGRQARIGGFRCHPLLVPEPGAQA